MSAPTIILGTRPEIIKMSPIAAELGHRNLPFQLIHTGQHYSRNMSEIFLRELGMPPLDHFLDIGKGTSSQQLAKCLTGLEKLFLDSPPSAILVEGDTNTQQARVALPSRTSHHPSSTPAPTVRISDRQKNPPASPPTPRQATVPFTHPSTPSSALTQRFG